MIKLKNLIERIFTKKNIKIFVLAFVVIGFFVGNTFAAGDSVQDKVLQDFSNILRILIAILSRGWILLASLAGKLMTNELVYGSFMNMDQALWNLWNMIKNFANFVLGFILIFSIVKNIFMVVKSDANPLKNAIDTVKKVLIAGVLVQMSWFLVGMALDLSTVATAVVGSIPSQIISNNSSNLQNHLNKLIESKQVKLEIDFNKSNMVETIKTGQLSSDDLKRIMDTITPSANSVIGPLIFLGGSVFDLFESSDTSKIESGSLTRRDLFLTLGVNGFVIISFTIMMAFIFLFNLFRVITLWIVIPLSPFIILMEVFNSKGDKLKINKDAFLGQVLSVKNVFNLIFKPVYMVFVLSIVLIVMTIVKGLAKNNDGSFTGSNYGNVSITSNRSGEGDDAVYDSSMDVDGFLKFSLNGTKNTIVDLIVYILGLVLMFMLMKACVVKKTGIGFIDNIMENISGALWGKEAGKIGGLLGSIGVVPVGDKKVGLNTMRKFRERVVSNEDNAWANFVGIDIDKQNKAIERIMGGTSFTTLISSRDKKEWIEQAVSIGKSKYSSLRAMKDDEDFQAALRAWNEAPRNKNTNQRIDIYDFTDEVWNTGTYGETPTTTPENGNGAGGGGQGTPQS